MRRSFVSLLISTSFLGSLLSLPACTHAANSDQNQSQASEKLEADAEAGEAAASASSLEEASVIGEIAPEDPPQHAGAAIEGGVSEDFIDPSEVGLTPGMPQLEPDAAAPSLAPTKYKKSKAKAKSKSKLSRSKSKAKSSSAATLVSDGDDSVGLQSESTASDPTSRVAEVSVMFAKGSSSLSKKYVQRLKEVAQQLRGDRQLKVSLAGKSDSKGNTKRNKALAAQRAQAVKKVLMQNGVKASQIRIEAVELLANSTRDASQGRIVEVFFQN